jgi:Zn-dependent peptidase ImmA (M78 family)
MRTIGEIRELASQILEDSGYSGIFPVPIDKIISYQEYTLKGINKEDAPKNFSGMVDHQKKMVVINNSHSSGRKRFTAAHELGHIILHPGENEIDYRISFSDPNIKETEANRFAAEILMPYKEFIDIYSKYDGYIPFIADYFGVSVGAATVRTESLGISN